MGTNATSSVSMPTTAVDRANLYDAFMSSKYNNIYGTQQQGLNMSSQVPQFSPYDQNTTLDAQYTGPTDFKGQYADPGTLGDTYQRLSNGDYNALEAALLKSNTAGLDQAWADRGGQIEADMAKRGIWRSGAPLTAKSQAYSKEFAPQYTAAAANAASQRYGLQSAENTAASQAKLAGYNANVANAQNAYGAGLNSFQANNAAALNQYNAASNNFAQSNQAYANKYKAEQDAKWRWPEYAMGTWNGPGGVVSSSNASGWSIRGRDYEFRRRLDQHGAVDRFGRGEPEVYYAAVTGDTVRCGSAGWRRMDSGQPDVQQYVPRSRSGRYPPCRE